MDFNIKTDYSDAVDHFEFLPATTEIENPVSSDKQESLNTVIDTIAKKILAATQLQSRLSAMAEKPLSLREVTLLFIQDSDKKTGVNTPQKIAEASVEDKKILHFAVNRLAESYSLLSKDELNVMALCFGIHEISALSSFTVATETATVKDSPIDKMQRDLDKLVSLRSKYAHIPEEQLSPQVRDFLANVDAMIISARAQLATLEEGLREKSSVS